MHKVTAKPPAVLLCVGMLAASLSIPLFILGHREPATWVFIVGFYVVVGGIAWLVFRRTNHFGIGFKVCIIGFLISSSSVLLAFLRVGDSGLARQVLFDVGIGVFLLGFALITWRQASRKKENDRNH